MQRSAVVHHIKDKLNTFIFNQKKKLNKGLGSQLVFQEKKEFILGSQLVIGGGGCLIALGMWGLGTG